MKKSLNITGSVELERKEVTQAVFEFLERQGYKAHKAVYLPSDEKFEGMVVEVVGISPKEEVKSFPGKLPEPEKLKRDNPGGHLKKNLGVFDTIRMILNDEYKKRVPGTTLMNVKFDYLLNEVVYFYPGMDKKKLYIYLYDKRQFTNINYFPKEGNVVVKGVVTPGRK